MLTPTNYNPRPSLVTKAFSRVIFTSLFIMALFEGCTHYTSAQLVKKGFDESNSSKRAIKWYSQAIRNDPNNVEAYWRRADVFFRRKQYAKSISDLNKAILLDSSYNVGYLFGDRGNVLEEKGDFSGALSDYTIALRFCPPSDPSTPRENFFFYRSRTKLKMEDTAGALIDNDSAIFYWKDFLRARYQRGRIEAIKGEFQKAMSDYQVSPITPDMAGDKEFLADVFYFGYLKFKTGDTSYCPFWKAAASNGLPIAINYITKYCSGK